ncbi:hypothetical protein AB0B45_50800 [Nonomuraea sp. NPDC049152]|uniref:hypothetical protein n=1 Tax=Nonomuraea sp. NPDC049152 TaxID=3154350 RepID=UPI0033D574D1
MTRPVISWTLGALALLAVGGFGLGAGFAAQLGRLTTVLPATYAPDVSGLVDTTSQLAGVAGVAVFGTLYLGLADRPVDAFAVVMGVFGVTSLVAAVMAHAAGRAAAPAAGTPEVSWEPVSGQ